VELPRHQAVIVGRLPPQAVIAKLVGSRRRLLAEEKRLRPRRMADGEQLPPPRAAAPVLRHKLAVEVLVVEQRLRPPQAVARLRRLQRRRLQMRCRPVRVVEVGVLVERRLQLAAAVVPVVRRRRIAGRRTMDAEARFRPPLAVGRLRQLPLRRRLLVLLRLVRLRLVHLRLVRVPAVEAAVERRLQPLDVEARLRLPQTAVRLRRH
jgi:hypothetical protein